MAVHLAIRQGLNELKGKERLGLQAYADGMLVIPKTLSQNAGYDPQEVLVKVLADASDVGETTGIGVDCSTGEATSAMDIGVLDNYRRRVVSLTRSQCFLGLFGYWSTPVGRDLLWRTCQMAGTWY